MAKILKGYLDKISNLQTKIDNDSKDILEFIDIDKLMENPEAYMVEFNKQYFESRDEIVEAIEAGEEKARKIMNKIK